MHVRIYVYRHKAYVALPAKVAYNCCNGCKMHGTCMFLQLVGNGA